MKSNACDFLALDLEYNSFNGVVYQIGAAKIGPGSCQYFNGLIPELLLECSAEKVNRRFCNSQENTLVGSYPIVLEAFREFSVGAQFIFTWGCDDGYVLAREANKKCLNIEKQHLPEMLGKFVNLQAIFAAIYPRSEKKLLNAVERVGLNFVGKPHDAVTDATNTLYLAEKIVTTSEMCLSTSYGEGLLDLLGLPVDEKWTEVDDTSSIMSFCPRSLLLKLGIM